jgi:hypothetical protein
MSSFGLAGMSREETFGMWLAQPATKVSNPRMRARPDVFRVVRLSPLLLWISGCLEPRTEMPQELIHSSEHPVIGGTRDHANEAVMLVVHEGGRICSGSLVSPNVLLTARHCVSRKLTGATLGCDRGADAASSPYFSDDESPSGLSVYKKSQYSFTAPGPPDAVGTSVLHPESPAICNQDMALIILDRDIPGVRPLAVRQSNLVKVGEQVEAVGFGLAAVGAPIDSAEAAGVRRSLTGLAILSVGPTVAADGRALGNSEFRVSRSGCSGDSGGPILSKSTGAVLGVMVRSDCATGVTSTTLHAFKYLFQRLEKAGGKPVRDEVQLPQEDSGAGAVIPTETSGDNPVPPPSVASEKGIPSNSSLDGKPRDQPPSAPDASSLSENPRILEGPDGGPSSVTAWSGQANSDPEETPPSACTLTSGYGRRFRGSPGYVFALLILMGQRYCLRRRRQPDRRRPLDSPFT